MFIREQMIDSIYDMAPAARDEFVEVWVWSPVACRHVNWIFK